MPDVFKSKNELGKSKNVHTHKLKKPVRRVDKPISRKERIASSISKSSVHELPNHSHSPLSSFLYYPDHVNFLNEDPEEEVVLLLRRHPITNLKWLLVASIMLIAPAFLSVLPPFELLPLRYQLMSFAIWYLMLAAFVFEEFLGWFFNVNIITDERIIEVDFYNLIYRELTDANIDQIQDVTVQVGGAARTYFNYGNVVIQTAAEIPQIEFGSVPKPDLVAKVLRDLRVEEEQEKIEGRVR